MPSKSMKGYRQAVDDLCKSRKLHQMPCRNCKYMGTQYCPDESKNLEPVKKEGSQVESIEPNTPFTKN